MGLNKRVSDPFNEKVRARLFRLGSSSSGSSSGSEHEGEYDLISPSPSPSPSPCLSYLVQNFLESDSNDTNTSVRDNEFELASDEPSPTALINNVINPTISNNADHFRINLLAHVTKAIEIFSFFRKSNKVSFHSTLVSYLREIGYDAGVCKTKWTSSGNLTAGNYEFIDVISPEKQERYVIDTEFAGEFEIARESKNYEKLRSSLPRVIVIKPEEMKNIVKLMCDEARRSIKINGLTMPPWRKNRYMQMKWFGPYRRSTSHSMPLSSVSSPKMSGFPVKCRALGFDVVGDGERFLFPPVTRTR